MIQVYQTRFPEIHGKGNCLGACLASLVEEAIEEIPPLEHLSSFFWKDAMSGFLNRKGYKFQGCGKPEKLKKYPGVDGYVITRGVSPRNPNATHAVIYLNGGLYHDPHPSGKGLVKIIEFYKIEMLPNPDVV